MLYIYQRSKEQSCAQFFHENCCRAWSAVLFPELHKAMIAVSRESIPSMLAHSRNYHDGFMVSGRGLRTLPYVLSSYCPYMAAADKD
jgi:hypothetical protein